ncbi:MAG: hypothetical protein KC502_19955 [Myxococcales bacterium]|nr:hypothetical protein [Myxococcales bacterium]
MTQWKSMKGITEHYVIVRGDRVIIGEHSGSGRTDRAMACSHAEFLAGRHDGLIRRVHGPDTLREMREAVETIGTDSSVSS